MKIKSLPIILVLSLVSFISCQKEPNFEKAISNLTDKFPQLAKQNSKEVEYKLTRSVTNGDRKFQLKLYSSVVNDYDAPQRIIIIVNQKSEYYAIPYFQICIEIIGSFQMKLKYPISKKQIQLLKKN